MNDSARIEYRQPVFLISLAAAQHLRRELSGPSLVSARSVYAAIAELHAEQEPATKPAISERSGISERKVRPHLARLEALGLLRITHRTTATGANGVTTYHLHASPIDPLATATPHSSSTDETSPSHGAAGSEPAFLQHGRNVPPGEPSQDETSPHQPALLQPGRSVPLGETRGDETSHPAGARPDAVSFVENSANASFSTTQTGERESEETTAPSSLEQARALWPDLSQAERDVLVQLVNVAKARGIDGWKPETAIGYLRNEFANRAHLREALKFAEYYSPGGAGENTPVDNLALRWRRWLDRAPKADTIVELDRRGSRGRGGRGQVDPVAVRAQVVDERARAEAAQARRREREDALVAQEAGAA